MLRMEVESVLIKRCEACEPQPLLLYHSPKQQRCYQQQGLVRRWDLRDHVQQAPIDKLLKSVT